MLDYHSDHSCGFSIRRVAIDNKRCQGRVIAVTI